MGLGTSYDSNGRWHHPLFFNPLYFVFFYLCIRTLTSRLYRPLILIRCVWAYLSVRAPTIQPVQHRRTIGLFAVDDEKRSIFW